MKIDELALPWLNEYDECVLRSYPKLVNGHRSELSVYYLYWITDKVNDQRYVLSYNEQVLLVSDKHTVMSLYEVCK